VPVPVPRLPRAVDTAHTAARAVGKVSGCGYQYLLHSFDFYFLFGALVECPISNCAVGIEIFLYTYTYTYIHMYDTHTTALTHTHTERERERERERNLFLGDFLLTLLSALSPESLSPALSLSLPLSLSL
jgi:hypothetical protein